LCCSIEPNIGLYALFFWFPVFFTSRETVKEGSSREACKIHYNMGEDVSGGIRICPFNPPVMAE